MRFVCLLLAACFVLHAAPVRAAEPVPPASSGEFIIISGGVSLWMWEKWKANPHDNWWMNFIRAARIRIQEIQAAQPDAQITWLVYRPSYVTPGEAGKQRPDQPHHQRARRVRREADVVR